MRFKNVVASAVAAVVVGCGLSAFADIIPKADVYATDEVTAVAIPAGGYANSAQACSDSTDVIIGGGCYNAGFSENIVITQHYALPAGSTSGPDYWVCEWRNNTSGWGYAHVRALCVSQ